MILAAAIKQNGLIFALPAPARHSDVITWMGKRHIKHDLSEPNTEQGFIDSRLGFIDRRQAAMIVEVEDQLVSPYDHPAILHSEDLW